MASMELKELNSEESKQYIGGVIFLSILMSIGLIGNSHVLIIYIFQMKKSIPRIFIIVLAALDFIICIIGMPFVIIDLLNPLTFTIIPACKILRFSNYLNCASSAFILIIIAIDRYRKVCAPLKKQITHRQAKLACILALCLSLSVCWPVPILFGHSSVNTTNPNISGVRCHTEDRFMDTPYQAYFNAFLVLIAVFLFGLLVVLYSLMARSISHHEEFRKSFSVQATIDKINRKDINNHQDPSNEEIMSSQNFKKNGQFRKRLYNVAADHGTFECIHLPSITLNMNGHHDSNHSPRNFLEHRLEHATHNSEHSTHNSEHSTHNSENRKQAKSHHRTILHFHVTRRTTLMMFLITIVFLLSYVPHLAMKIWLFIDEDLLERASFTEKVIYNTFVWCFFVNNVTNAFIYGFFDNRFRQNIKTLYKNIFGICF